MNKHLSLILFLAILVSGCNQEELSRNESVNGKTFTASFEQNESRTYIEDGKYLRWTTGDYISLFNSNTLNQQYKFDGKTGDNSGTFSKVETTFGTGNDLNCHYAVYPYASDITITESGIITATLPAEQNYAENSFGLDANTMVAVTENTDDTFLKFKNVGGYLKLQLYGDNVTVKSITLTGNNNEKLAGVAKINPVYGQDPTISMDANAIENITLDCGEGVKIGSTAETATAFWIVVPPTTFENGFEVTITDINDNGMTKSTSNEISIARNVIKPMAVFEVKTATEIVAVDLGLSVKWANCNIGANNPHEYGDYFAWGETAPKSSYDYSNMLILDKIQEGLKSTGVVDSNGNLTAAYDAATVNWGGNWRMPTRAEIEEILNNCTWTWTTQNDTKGYLVCSKTNGNSIFLPAAGFRQDTSLGGSNEGASYWSSTYDWDIFAFNLQFNNNGIDTPYKGCNSSFDCSMGFLVRPVTE